MPFLLLPALQVDRMYGWKHVKDRPFLESLEAQDESTQGEFESRASSVLLQLAEQGLNAQLYYKNKDFREYVSLIPTSAITGEGVPDILMLLVQLSQKSNLSPHFAHALHSHATCFPATQLTSHSILFWQCSSIVSCGVPRSSARYWR